MESRQALPAIREYLAATGRYQFVAGAEARSVENRTVRDDHGNRYEADLVLVCAGAAHGGLVRDLAGELPVRRVRLQMMQTEPLDEPLTTAIADADSFRYYPGFAGPRWRRCAATNLSTRSPSESTCSCFACNACTAA